MARTTKQRAAKRASRRGAASHGVTIRKATARDIPAITALNMEMMRFHAARDKDFQMTARDARSRLAAHKSAQLRRRNARLTVAGQSGKVIAYCLSVVASRPPIYRVRTMIQVMDMCVAARHRRRGLGRRLFEDAVEWAKSRSIRRIEVSFAPSNELARSFWPSLGFRTFMQRGYLEL